MKKLNLKNNMETIVNLKFCTILLQLFFINSLFANTDLNKLTLDPVKLCKESDVKTCNMLATYFLRIKSYKSLKELAGFSCKKKSAFGCNALGLALELGEKKSSDLIFEKSCDLGGIFGCVNRLLKICRYDEKTCIKKLENSSPKKLALYKEYLEKACKLNPTLISSQKIKDCKNEKKFQFKVENKKLSAKLDKALIGKGKAVNELIYFLIFNYKSLDVNETSKALKELIEVKLWYYGSNTREIILIEAIIFALDYKERYEKSFMETARTTDFSRCEKEGLTSRQEDLCLFKGLKKPSELGVPASYYIAGYYRNDSWHIHSSAFAINTLLFRPFAQAEVEAAIIDIYEYRYHKDFKKLDMCQYATSGLMQGNCAAEASRKEESLIVGRLQKELGDSYYSRFQKFSKTYFDFIEEFSTSVSYSQGGTIAYARSISMKDEYISELHNEIKFLFYLEKNCEDFKLKNFKDVELVANFIKNKKFNSKRDYISDAVNKLKEFKETYGKHNQCRSSRVYIETLSSLVALDIAAVGFGDDEIWREVKYKNPFKPSFNCKKAKDKHELSVCKLSTLSILDKHLNLLYKLNKKKDKKVKQRQWLSKVKELEMANDVYAYNYDLKNLYLERIIQLMD